MRCSRSRSAADPGTPSSAARAASRRGGCRHCGRRPRTRRRCAARPYPAPPGTPVYYPNHHGPYRRAAPSPTAILELWLEQVGLEAAKRQPQLQDRGGMVTARWRAEVACDVVYALGEGPLWDGPRDRALWLDILAGT